MSFTKMKSILLKVNMLSPFAQAFVFAFFFVATNCDQSGNNQIPTDYQDLKDEVQFLRESVKQLQEECADREKRFVADGEMDIEQEVIRLRRDLDQLKQGTGSTYIRWGRTSCPVNASLVYKGFMGGNVYTDRGGPANYVCLPEDPTWGKYQDGIQSHGNRMYGTEYELFGSFNPFDKQVHNEDAPCAVCRAQHETTIMIPARTDCYSGWHRQYTGYLMTVSLSHPAAGEYVCVDSSPEQLPHGTSNQDGNVLYVVEAVCGSLPCLPYVNGRELACVVCSK